MSTATVPPRQNGKHFNFASIETAIERYRRGEILIVVDDEDRENEGDLVLAAEHATPEKINFLIREGRGLICVGIPPERASQLALPAMTAQNTARLGTAFTVSVDALKDTTTGISAFDRAATIRALADPATRPEDLGRPGHIFPLVARDGGVVVRPGHTEAVVDLARLAGLLPAGVLCEVLDDDGRMARLPRLFKLAEKFGLIVIKIQDLLDYRRRKEQLIEQVSEVSLPTRFGDFQLHLFQNRFQPEEHHLALVKGDPTVSQPALVRVHSECLTGDIFGSHRCDCGNQLHEALKRIDETGAGALLYMRQEGRGIGLVNKILAYRLQEQGKDTVEANEALGFAADLREYWFAARMLSELGIHRIRLMTNNPRKIQQLETYGIEIAERVPLICEPNPANQRYLFTKGEKMGHLIF